MSLADSNPRSNLQAVEAPRKRWDTQTRKDPKYAEAWKEWFALEQWQRDRLMEVWRKKRRFR